MNILDIAKRDQHFINTDVTSGFAELQYWTSPTGTIATISGRHVKHHLGLNEEGKAVNTKTASCTFSEQSMIDANYPIRNSKNEVAMKNHKVEIKDSTGNLYKYVVREFLPDETLGMIVCILTANE